MYVRFKRSTAGTSSGNITHTSTGANPVDLGVSGTAAVYYTLTTAASPTADGSVTLNPSGGSYASGTTVTLTPVPSSGYAFSSWSGTNAGDIVNTGGVYTIVVNGNKSVTANFVPTTTATFQYGANSYTGTIDTFIRGTTDGTLNFSTNTGLEWDENTGSTTDEIALIRFTGLFSSEGGPIPDGATITSASLTYRVTDLTGGSTANGDPANVYESLVDWPGTTATYNNFGGEADVQADEYRATPVVSAPATALSTDYTIDVTASVQRWSTTPAENLGWVFLPTASDGVTIYSSDFATVAYHPLLSVSYVNRYTLTAGNDGNGSVTLNPAGGSYNHGTTVTLTPVPVSGYTFSNWTGTNAGDLTDNGNGTWSIVMTEAKSVTANFDQLCYTLTTTADPAGGGTVSADPTPNCNGGTHYTHGTEVELTATANTGCAFANWSGDASGTTSPTSVTMTEDKSVTAHFVDTMPPTLDIKGATADSVDMAGDLATGYILATTNDPTDDWLIQFKSGTVASEALEDTYFGLKLIASTVTPADLKAYYDGRGVPDPFLTYLKAAADGINPFVYIKGSTVTLVDAAKHDLVPTDVAMTVPDDFPLGTYTVQGVIKDVAGNESPVTLILVVTGDRPPVVTITMSQLSWPPIPGAASYNVYQSTTKPYFENCEPGDPANVCSIHSVSGVPEPSYILPTDTSYNYYYFVRTVNGAVESADSNRVGKFSFQLVPGQ